jgi:WD40 repeat protein
LLLDSDHLPKGVKRTLVRTFHPWTRTLKYDVPNYSQEAGSEAVNHIRAAFQTPVITTGGSDGTVYIWDVMSGALFTS